MVPGGLSSWRTALLVAVVMSQLYFIVRFVLPGLSASSTPGPAAVGTGGGGGGGGGGGNRIRTAFITPLSRSPSDFRLATTTSRVAAAAAMAAGGSVQGDVESPHARAARARQEMLQALSNGKPVNVDFDIEAADRLLDEQEQLVAAGGAAAGGGAAGGGGGPGATTLSHRTGQSQDAAAALLADVSLDGSGDADDGDDDEEDEDSDERLEEGDDEEDEEVPPESLTEEEQANLVDDGALQGDGGGGGGGVVDLEVEEELAEAEEEEVEEAELEEQEKEEAEEEAAAAAEEAALLDIDGDDGEASGLASADSQTDDPAAAAAAAGGGDAAGDDADGEPQAAKPKKDKKKKKKSKFAYTEKPPTYSTPPIPGVAPIPPSAIDIVYTYINRSVSKQLKSTFKTELGKNKAIDAAASDSSRYRDRGELCFSMRSVAQNLQWFNGTIHIVTDTPPAWLDLSHPRIRIVPEAAIMKPEHLPTFNSMALEANIHKAPGLAPYYLYFNDDFFMGAPVPFSDFTGPSHTCSSFWTHRADIGTLRMVSPHRRALVNVHRLIDNHLNLTHPAPRQDLAHIPHFFNRSIVEEIHRTFGAQLEAQSAHRFRSGEDLHMAHLYAYWLRETGGMCAAWHKVATRCDGRGPHCFSVKKQMSSFRREMRALRAARASPEGVPRFLNFNDGVGDPRLVRRRAMDTYDFLRSLFPRPSEFERYDCTAHYSRFPLSRIDLREWIEHLKKQQKQAAAARERRHARRHAWAMRREEARMRRAMKRAWRRAMKKRAKAIKAAKAKARQHRRRHS